MNWLAAHVVEQNIVNILGDLIKNLIILHGDRCTRRAQAELVFKMGSLRHSTPL